MSQVSKSFCGEISLHRCSGSAVVASSFWAKLLVLTSLHQAVAIRSSGCGSSEVLSIKGLQFWSSAPFSGEGEVEKRQECCYKPTDRPIYSCLFLIAYYEVWSLSVSHSPNSVVVTYIYSVMTVKLSVLLPIESCLPGVCSVALPHEVFFSLFPLSVGVPGWAAFS